MKIIDLLNKIANGEAPRKIKYKEKIYEKDSPKAKENGYVCIDKYGYYHWLNSDVEIDDINNLNDEVEIIEEDKPVIAKEELENRIENALEFLETQYNTFPSGEMWREALKNTLQGKEYDDVYVEDKKIENMIKLNNISNPSDITALSTMQWENNRIIEKKINEIIDIINKGDN